MDPPLCAQPLTWDRVICPRITLLWGLSEPPANRTSRRKFLQKEERGVLQSGDTPGPGGENQNPKAWGWYPYVWRVPQNQGVGMAKPDGGIPHNQMEGDTTKPRRGNPKS